MILLNEVAKKLENILNGSDSEVVALGLQPPTGFYFKVATEGFHIDKVFDMEEGKNFIPVFISSMGGNFNPVPDLMQANYVIPIAIYFPVRFKTELYRLNEYLARVFVGRQLNYGSESGTALSNISVAQFGEIIESDLEEFKEWEETTYKMPIEVMEPLLQMQLSLYLSTAAQEFVYGNDAECTLTIGGVSAQDLETYFHNDVDNTIEAVSFVQQSLQSNSEPAVQQLLGGNQTEGLPVNTSYASSFSVYIKDNDFFKYLIKKWFDGDIQTMTLQLNLTMLGQEYTRNVFVQSMNLMIQKGELATITFALVKKVVLS